jgi:c-di-GMP-binding flagellar brake protein YcgR
MNENLHERRYTQRFPIHQYVLINLGNGGQEIAAFSENISSGGALVYCERFLAANTQVSVIVALPAAATQGANVRVWCDSQVVRVEPQLREGRFGIALEFLSFHLLPQA